MKLSEVQTNCSEIVFELRKGEIRDLIEVVKKTKYNFFLKFDSIRSMNLYLLKVPPYSIRVYLEDDFVSKGIFSPLLVISNVKSNILLTSYSAVQYAYLTKLKSKEDREDYEASNDAEIIITTGDCDSQMFPLLYNLEKKFKREVRPFDGGHTDYYEEWKSKYKSKHIPSKSTSIRKRKKRR